MAREQRKDVDYFPHDCTHGRKMHIIEAKYGNDGYATWFKLLEQLGKANNHFIDISDEMTLMFLVSLFKTDEDKTLLILGDLAKLGSIDKTLYEKHQIIFSKKFTDSIQDAYRKRKLECFKYSDVLAFAESKNNQSSANLPEDSLKNDTKQVINPEVILKEKNSIVKKRKEEQTEEEIEIDISLPNSEDKTFLEIINIFNSICIEIPKVQSLSEKRKGSIRGILKEYSLEQIGDVFRNVSESNFLKGKVTNFIASFDWIMQPDNFIKILEHNYKNNGKEQSTNAIGKQSAETIASNLLGWEDLDRN